MNLNDYRITLKPDSQFIRQKSVKIKFIIVFKFTLTLKIMLKLYESYENETTL